MDHRGHPWPDSGRPSHRAKDREDYYRYPQQDRDQSYPPSDPRERDRHWAHPDPRYSAHFTSPPARPEQYPYNSHQYPYGYGRPEHQRPQSRCVRLQNFKSYGRELSINDLSRKSHTDFPYYKNNLILGCMQSCTVNTKGLILVVWCTGLGRACWCKSPDSSM